ncbi:MAG: motif family protein [Acidobacteriota bacterium]|jgi:Spy/CpxP family protein refolding chaperone|nr:motif family protein [Acidobacteriota bacterium]
MRLKGSRRFVGGLALAAGFALTGVVGVSAQQEQGQGSDRGRAERPWGQKEGGRGGERRGGDGPFGGRFGAELNLTDAQREQLRQIEERYRASSKAQHEGRGQRQERGGYDPLAGGTFDEAAVRAAAQARANAQVEREVAHARMMHEMYNVLTSEQKAQLTAARQQREQRRQEFRTRRGDRQGQTQLQ